MAVPNTNFDQLTAITNDYFMPTMPDLVFDANPFLSRLHAKGTKAQGGAKIRQDLMYQFSKDGAYFDYAKGSTDAEDQFTAAEFNWKLYRQRVVISVPEINRNAGPEGVFKILKGKMEGAATAIRDSIGTDMHVLTYDDDAANINSLPNILGDNTFPSTNKTAGGIAKSNSFWRGTNSDFTTGSLGGVSEMNTLWFAIADGNIGPDFVLSGSTALKNHMEDGTHGPLTTSRFVNTMTMKTGFTTYEYMGATWMQDRHVSATAGQANLYLLNSKFIDLVSHKNENFRFSGFMTPTNQNVQIGWIYWMGNLTSSDPSRSGMLYT